MSAAYAATCEACSWTGGPYKTPGYADYALRRHSCAKQRTKDAARLRRVRARSKIDRTPKPCTHKHADHTHGTRTAYVLDRCRCRPCARANADYERTTRRQKAYGRWDGLVDANPARAHIKELTNAGMGLKQITKASGISGGMLTKLIYGTPRPDGTRRPPAARIKPSTAERILAVRLTLASGAVVPSTGARRRLQALACNGWSIGALATRGGVDRQRLDQAMSGHRIQHDTHQVVADLYEQLWDVQAPPSGPATRTRNRARRMGWAPAMAWDDDTIDNPDAVPDMGEPTKTMGPRQRLHVEDVEHLLNQVDYTWDGLAPRLGVGRRTIERALHRAGRRDLHTRLTLNTTGETAA